MDAAELSRWLSNQLAKDVASKSLLLGLCLVGSRMRTFLFKPAHESTVPLYGIVGFCENANSF